MAIDRTHASLTISHTSDPRAEVTALLGIEPRTSFEIGDALSTGSERPREHSMWSLARGLPVADEEVEVADRVQADIIETLWPDSSTNWPPCPAHPRSQPMRPAVVDGNAVWCCTDGTVYSQIGSLVASGHQARRGRKRPK